MTHAYYNENDPFAAAWLRNLISAGLVAKGEVDERSIEDVQPDDLRGFRQCHFFAGIGVWSYALKQAGWPDDRRVWTGSCPCQSFSAAGQRKGFADKRHLWPSWFRLIRECRPETLFGEQVAAKDALAWLDLVHDDLEGEGYAVGAIDTCAASVGAPHIRQRLYWMAKSDSSKRTTCIIQSCGNEAGSECSAQSSLLVELAHPDGGLHGDGLLQRSGEYGFQQEDGGVGGPVVHFPREQMGVPGCARESRGPLDHPSDPRRDDSRQRDGGSSSLAARSEQSGSPVELGFSNGSRLAMREDVGGVQRKTLESSERETVEFSGDAMVHSTSYWSDCDWLPCIDGKSRPAEPGTFPLAHGAPARVGRLRGYGNALVAPQAQAFIECAMEVLG